MGSPAEDFTRRQTHHPAISFSDFTLNRLLYALSRNRLNTACVVSADGQAMTWQQLIDQLERVRTALRMVGIGPNDRVAIALANGPTLATAFLAVAACTGCAPLNPACTQDECEFYLNDFKAKALITTKGAAVAAANAAARLGIPIFECQEDSAVPGRFALDTSNMSAGAATFGETGPDSPALYLYTSGTTSKPKLVPLRHKNLVASAQNIVTTLQLSSTDRCLNLMPLFHIHGLMGGLLAPLAAGGSTVCPPSLRPGDFFLWMERTRPTWYTAVPTMHRVVVSEAKDHAATIEHCRLRFVRSSSAPLPAALFDQLVRVFAAPVLEAYSMTEAAHQMTCNPLGSGKQRRGTVGVAAGPEVAIMDEAGHIVAPGGTGEVVIRGPSVMSGYEANPQANATAFTNGWFRTGDQGRLDAEGYLTLTGRLKEQINRGGEKLAPLEIDQVLLTHPDIVEAATFGCPHPTLGEEVAAAVVIRPGAKTTPDQIQAFLRDHLAGFKIPRRILLVSAIPKGPTGKVQRGQLHKQLSTNSTGVRTIAVLDDSVCGKLEGDLLRLWREALNDDSIGLEDDFFEKGGDSLMAVQMLLDVEKLVGHSIPESILIDHSTVSQLARGLTDIGQSQARPLIRLQGGDCRPPLFFFHGDYDGGYYTRRIARLLGPSQTFISVAPHGLGPESIPASIEAMAWNRLPLLLQAQPDGPFRLAGYCNAGMVALEVANLLRQAGRQVDMVFLIDVPMLNLSPAVRGIFRTLSTGFRAITPACETRAPRLATTMDMLWRQASNLRAYRRDPTLLRHAAAKLVRFGGAKAEFLNSRVARLTAEALRREQELARIYNRLFRNYVPSKTDLRVVYLAAEHDGAALHHLGPNVDVIDVPGGHWGCITTHVETLTRHIRLRLEALDENAASQKSAAVSVPQERSCAQPASIRS